MPALPDFICGWRLITLSVVMLFASGGILRSADEEFTPPAQVVVECQVVFLPQKLALPLIPDLSDDAKIDGAWARVMSMVESGEARLVANLFGRTAERKPLIVQTIEEWRYPTEFEAALPPLTTPKEEAVEMLRHWPVTGVSPTAFETRNTGWSLEFENAVSPDRQWIWVRAYLAGVRLPRFSKEEAGILPSGRRLIAEQPQFDSIRETLNLHLRAGQRVLVSVHKLPDAENMMALGAMRIRTAGAGGVP